jgi:parvulin-like peptidyl-prolyl isomerase
MLGGFFLASLTIILASASMSLAEVVDKIAVLVNDEVVTRSEVDSFLAPAAEEYGLLYHGEALAKKVEEARQRVFEQLIEQKLLLSAAKRENIEVKDREVENQIDDVRKKIGSKEEFESALRRQNLSLNDLKKRFTEQIMVRKYVDKKVVSKITVSPAEVSEYYQAHAQEFNEPEKIRLSNILIRLKEDRESMDKASELAKEILRRLREGGDFAGLAKLYSEGPGAAEGGSMGYVKRGDLKKEIEDAVFGMKPGEVSDIIQTSLGYHIFKLEERIPARSKDLSEVRVEIEDKLFHDKINQGIKEAVKMLRKNAYIAFK